MNYYCPICGSPNNTMISDIELECDDCGTIFNIDDADNRKENE